MAVEHPHVDEAMEELHTKGVPVFTLLSELTAPSRAGHIGLDSRKAGRTAAWTISRLAKRPGNIDILIGSHRYLCQDLAEISFRSYVRESAPQFQLREPLLNLDDRHLAYEATVELLARNGDLVGLYVAGRRHGGGNPDLAGRERRPPGGRDVQ